MLSQAIKEGGPLAISRYIEGQGTALYNLAAGQGLEGVVAKRKSSLYYPGKRTKDWIKFKHLQDDDFVVCGYIEKGSGVVSLVLGQYDAAGNIVDKGHVTLGVSREAFAVISKVGEGRPLFPQKTEYDVKWLRPELVCTVKYMEKMATGGLRQPVFKGLREDKDPCDCEP
jgi:bifunctional non-homologous end joining protein LigD/DNA ligase-1